MPPDQQAAALAALGAVRRDNTDPSLARPMDLLLPLWPSGADAASTATGCDAVVASPCSLAAMAERLRGAETAPAVFLAHERKLREEGEALERMGITAYPLAISTNGRFHPAFMRFVAEAAARWGRMTGVSAGEAHMRLVQTLSVVLQRANGTMLRKAGQDIEAAARGAQAPQQGAGAPAVQRGARSGRWRNWRVARRADGADGRDAAATAVAAAAVAETAATPPS